VLAFEAGRKKRIRVNTISAGINGLPLHQHMIFVCFPFLRVMTQILDLEQMKPIVGEEGSVVKSFLL